MNSRDDGHQRGFQAPPRPDARHVRRVLFVCLGNICRSPLAQGVLEHLAIERGVRSQLTIESCGTGGWHVGDPPDPRTIESARNNGVTLRSRARQLAPATDFDRFQLILAMDEQNRRDILSVGGPPERVALFLSYAPHELASEFRWQVPDPYHGGAEGFRQVFTLVHAASSGLLSEMFP